MRGSCGRIARPDARQQAQNNNTRSVILRLRLPEVVEQTRPPEPESVTMSKLNKSIVAEFESAQITR